MPMHHELKCSILQVKKFWKRLERPGFSLANLRSMLQYKQNRHQHCTVNSTRRAFLNTIPLPVLSVDAGHRVKLFRDCCFSAGNYKDHIDTMENQEDTCRTQQVPTSSHPNKGGPSTWVPVFQPAAPPPPVWGQWRITHHGLPLFLL